MKEPSITNFGLLIAYLLPGFVALWAVSMVDPTVAGWFGSSSEDAPSVGGFLYVTLASILAGLTVSTIRWLVIDTVHHMTGINRPSWDFSRLEEKMAAIDMLVESFYRYYQFYANMVIALAAAVTVRFVVARPDASDVAMVIGAVVFFVGSRDTLRKYYDRVGQLLRTPKSRQSASGKKSRKRDPVELTEIG